MTDRTKMPTLQDVERWEWDYMHGDHDVMAAEWLRTLLSERDRLKAKLADAIGILDGLMRDMGAAVFGKDVDAVEELIAAAKEPQP